MVEINGLLQHALRDAAKPYAIRCDSTWLIGCRHQSASPRGSHGVKSGKKKCALNLTVVWHHKSSADNVNLYWSVVEIDNDIDSPPAALQLMSQRGTPCFWLCDWLRFPRTNLFLWQHDLLSHMTYRRVPRPYRFSQTQFCRLKGWEHILQPTSWSLRTPSSTTRLPSIQDRSISPSLS